MGPIRMLISAVAFFPMTIAAQEVTIANLLESLGRLDKETPVESRCAQRLEEANVANAPNLFYSAALCFRQKQSFNGTFLLLAGQIRSTTDLQVLEPRSQRDQEVMGTLWQILFYQLGGTGDEALYLDPAKRKALFDQLSGWQPTISRRYDPGWNYRAYPGEERYSQAIASAKLRRTQQLESYARLISDPRYYAARQELNELHRRSGRAINLQSEDGKRATELTKQMNDISKELGVDFPR